MLRLRGCKHFCSTRTKARGKGHGPRAKIIVKTLVTFKICSLATSVSVNVFDKEELLGLRIPSRLVQRTLKQLGIDWLSSNYKYYFGVYAFSRDC